MKKLLIGGLLATSALFVLASATASAGVNDPGSGCNDQPNGASCVPDPSDNGQDCEAHGQNEDGNENHCLTTTATTTTTIPTTSVTVPPPVDTTTSTPPPVTSTTTAPPITTTAPDPTHTSSPIPPTTGGNSGNGSHGDPLSPPAELAYTGASDWMPWVAGIALALLFVAIWAYWLGKKLT